MADEKEEGLVLIKSLEIKQATKLLHGLVDGICKCGHPTYQDYSKTWSLQEWWTLSEACQSFFKTSIKNILNKDQILKMLECLPEEYRSVFLDVVNARRSDIRQQLQAESNAISQSVLTDFDWQVKLVMSSDKLSSVHEPLLTLDLDVQSEAKKRTHSLELNKEDLRRLISTLEGANKVVQQWKT